MTSLPRPVRLGFLLIDGFAMISYASVFEPFRAANTLSGNELYSWQHYSCDGEMAHASSGMGVTVNGAIGDAPAPDILFVCAGGNPAAFNDARTFAALRRLARLGAMIGGVSGGPFLVARAGLLQGFRCTIHWEHEASLLEEFPMLRVERALYVVDRTRLTCAGGVAALDLALDLIARAHGATLATQIGDWYIRAEERPGEAAQRQGVVQRYGLSHPGLVAALTAMQDNTAEPLVRDALAERAGLSVRQLERLFRREMQTSVNQHYLKLRLEAAMQLVRQTTLSRSEIAVACGFTSIGHFSRVFKNEFGSTPTEARKTRHNQKMDFTKKRSS